MYFRGRDLLWFFIVLGNKAMLDNRQADTNIIEELGLHISNEGSHPFSWFWHWRTACLFSSFLPFHMNNVVFCALPFWVRFYSEGHSTLSHVVLWHERNIRTLSGEEQSIPALKFSFLQTLYNWLKASNLFCSNSLSGMLDSCAVEV